MRKHQDGKDPGTDGNFGKEGLDIRPDALAKHVNDKDFKKGKSTSEKRGDEDEV